MGRKNGSDTDSRDKKGRFLPGNPGRPQGARNAATKAAEALLDGEAEALTRKAVEMAIDGDVTALRLCLERVLPPRRDRPIEVDLSTLENAKDLPEAIAAVLRGIGEGHLTPSEGGQVVRILGEYGRAVELGEFEERLQALERVKGGR